MYYDHYNKSNNIIHSHVFFLIGLDYYIMNTALGYQNNNCKLNKNNKNYGKAYLKY